jgi:pimeloyl-ACP methyl ester carboxylesterase
VPRELEDDGDLEPEMLEPRLGFLDHMTDQPRICAGRRIGFSRSLNYYRNVDRNWELMAAFDGTKVTVPAL